jgi:hypothetical protein
MAGTSPAMTMEVRPLRHLEHLFRRESKGRHRRIRLAPDQFGPAVGVARHSRAAESPGSRRASAKQTPRHVNHVFLP